MLMIDKDKLKLLLANRKNKLERPKYDGIGELISGISLIITLCLADFNQISFMQPQHFQILAWLVSLSILAFGTYSLLHGILCHYSVDHLYNEIADLDPNNEHSFNIILLKNSPALGAYLVFKSNRWSCWLFPNYHCLDGPFDPGAEAKQIQAYLKRDLNISQDASINYIGNEISQKYSFSDKINKKYNFHYFQVSNIQLPFSNSDPFYFNGKNYRWLTLDKMIKNKNIMKKNGDVLDYVRKNCDVN